MFGFLIGTACLFGLIAVVRRGRGHWGWRGRRWGRGPGPRGWMNGLFARLETSPSQEKVIVSAVDDVRGALHALRGEAEVTRADLARMLSDETFDAEKLGDVFTRHDDELRKVRAAVAGAIGRVHAALDHNQRTELARLLEQGPFFGRSHGGPYRESVRI